MTIEELRDKLRKLQEGYYDPEVAHGSADDLLIEYINDEEVTKLFNSLDKWYA